MHARATHASATHASATHTSATHASTTARSLASAASVAQARAVLAVAPTTELNDLFQAAVDELAPPASRASIADKKRFGASAAAATSAATTTTTSSDVNDRRVAAAIYTLLGPGAPLAAAAGLARARTAFQTPPGAPPFLAQLLANARDLLQTDDTHVHTIYEAIAGVVKYGVGITPAGELALRTNSPRALLTRMLETRALLDGEQPFEFADNALLLDMVVGAVQTSCAAYVHARTPARAQLDVVLANLTARTTSAVDWNAKVQEAADQRRVAFLPDGAVVVL